MSRDCARDKYRAPTGKRRGGLKSLFGDPGGVSSAAKAVFEIRALCRSLSCDPLLRKSRYTNSKAALDRRVLCRSSRQKSGQVPLRPPK